MYALIHFTKKPFKIVTYICIPFYLTLICCPFTIMSTFSNDPKNICLITQAFHDEFNNHNTLFERDRILDDFCFVSASDKYFGSGTFADDTTSTTKVICIGGELHLSVTTNGDMSNVPPHLIHINFFITINRYQSISLP